MNDSASNDTWSEYRRLILSELERLNANIIELTIQLAKLRHDDLAQMNTEITTLKQKAGVWGLMGGMIPVIITMLIYILRGN